MTSVMNAYKLQDWLDLWLIRQHQDALNGDKSHAYVNMLHTFRARYWEWLGFWYLSDLEDGRIIQKFYDWLCDQHKHLSPGYRALIMTTLKSCISEGIFQMGFHMSPWPKVKKTDYQKKIPKVLTEEEQEIVLGYIPNEHKVMVMLFFYHGLRMAEIRRLTWYDVNLETECVTVPTAKGGNDRIIVLEPKLARALDEMYCNSLKDRVFVQQDGKPYTRSVMHKIIKSALRQAGFPDVTPNQAGRHSSATNYLKRGASTRQVQYLLGHSKITTTERYCHPEVLDQYNLRREEK